MTFQRTILSRMVGTEARFQKLQTCVGLEAASIHQSKMFGNEGKAGDKRTDTGRNKNDGKVLLTFTYFFVSLLFWPRHMAHGILVPQPGIEPAPAEVEAQSPNQRTTGKSPFAFVGFLAASSRLTCGPQASSCDAQASLPHPMLDLSRPARDQTHVPCIARQILNHRTTREVPHNFFFFNEQI